MDPFGFAHTKIKPPRLRAALLARPALASRLAEAVGHCRIVLLVAPAGFGKTSVLARQWPALPPGTAAAWVSMDEGDDAALLYACLTAALEPYDLPWRTSPEALVAALDQGPPGRRQAVTALVNALAAADAPQGVIVLDDLHRLHDPAALDLLDQLIERLPEHWTLVMASRHEPALSLGRWRAAGEVASFDQHDLRFGYDEVEALAAQVGGDALAERGPELYERTDGWPAGLQLGLAVLRQRPDAPIAGPARQPSTLDRHLYDFLAAEVVDAMEPPLRDFLLRCSVLPELTATRCAAVSGDAQAAHWLDEIEHQGLFAQVLDTEERTLVLHDLFRDCLDELLSRRHGDERRALLQRAAASEPDGVRRIGYLLRAADWSAAESALIDEAPALLARGALAEVARLVQQFPADWQRRSAALPRLRGTTHWMRWQWSEMLACMEASAAAARAAGDDAAEALAQVHAAAAMNALGRNDDCQRLLDAVEGRLQTVQGRVLKLQCECAQLYDRGELGAIAPRYAAIVAQLELADEPQLWWQGTPEATYGTLPGMKPVHERYFAGALRHCGDEAGPLRATVYTYQAYWHLWAGEPEEALARAEMAEADHLWLGEPSDIAAFLGIFRGLAAALTGQADEVESHMARLYAQADDDSDERREVWRHQIAFVAMRLVDVMGRDPQRLRRWGERIHDRAAGSVYEVHSGRGLSLPARMAAAEGRWPAAASAFEALLPQADRVDTMGQAVELRLRCAHAQSMVGDLDRAAGTLRPALQRLRDDGQPGLALMAGPQVLAELTAQGWDGRLQADERRQLQALLALAGRWRRRQPGAPSLPAAVSPSWTSSGTTSGTPSAPSPATSAAAVALRATGPAAVGTPALGRLALDAPAPVARAPLDSPSDDPVGGLLAAGLTSREIEVLARLAAGDSNKLIARAFDLSPHTVKRHVANILGKLGVASRGQAAARYRQLG